MRFVSRLSGFLPFRLFFRAKLLGVSSSSSDVFPFLLPRFSPRGIRIMNGIDFSAAYSRSYTRRFSFSLGILGRAGLFRLSNLCVGRIFFFYSPILSFVSHFYPHVCSAPVVLLCVLSHLFAHTRMRLLVGRFFFARAVFYAGFFDFGDARFFSPMGSSLHAPPDESGEARSSSAPLNRRELNVLSTLAVS